MIRRPLGATGLSVSALGFGCGPLGDERLSEQDAERLVHEALDLGVNLFDTAPSYGVSESRLGRALASRRHEAVVVTKGGYAVPGVQDWTPECLALGVDRALGVLGTDVIDVFVLHSCDAATLLRGDLFEPLVRAKEAGKLRAMGYSGDGEALRAAVRSGMFDVVECSVNVLDRSALEAVKGTKLGVLAKRSLANAVWERPASHDRPDLEEYGRRFSLFFTPDQAPSELPLDELFVRFAAHSEGVSSALVGTSRSEGLRRAVSLALRGPLPTAVATDLAARYVPFQESFHGLV